MKSKDIICDASSLIALTDSCFLDILYEMHNRYGIRFLIPESVRYECIEHPLNIKEYAMSAIRILDAYHDGVIEVVGSNVDKEINDILHITNNLFYARGKSIHLVDRGEAGMIAIANDLNINNLLMDERTTRMLIEAPMEIKRHLENELNVHIAVNEKNLDRFHEMTRGINVFRSAELIALAYERGWFDRFQNIELKALQAALYRIKFAGCSIGFKEIERLIDYYRRKR
ncbi:hypothetical protein J7K41_00285 [Candidatus Micrarchaeota archaeon]|nr:hypothetical protein [Candidatus Micrarchaeota archaeon]